MEISSIPPGFESIAPFKVKKVEDNDVKMSVSPVIKFELKTETESPHSDDCKTEKSQRPRPWINSLDNSSGDDSDTEQTLPLRPRLPKGVIRGCNDCVNCQKVTAKWRPEEACKPDLEEVPVFYPTKEEFEDPIKYIESIRSKAEAYGICRIVPPSPWKPPCPLKQKQTWENSKFATRIQRIDKIQNRDSMRKILDINHNKRRKKRRCMKAEEVNNSGDAMLPDNIGHHEAERFGFEPGPDFTMQAFHAYADDFKTQYFMRHSSNSYPEVGVDTAQGHLEAPSVENIEGEYWRVVQRPTEEIEVLYGADLETGVFGSGFPKNSNQVYSDSDLKYANSGWNLNNFPRLPGSVLSYESSDISGVLVPWLYIGMCFSSFCWHVEDHHLYSLNYMHWGDSKIWYGVPASNALKLEEAMRKHLPDLFEEQPDLLHKLVTQLSPSILKTEGVPVYRCVQNAGEFVLTFPRAYHAGFNCGFNCAEAVNVAPVDWLPHGQNAIELYREQGRKTSVSHDKLLLGAARDAVKAHWEISLLKKNTKNNLRWRDVCGKDGILCKAFKSRVEIEKARRDYFGNSSQALKMDRSFDAINERECSVCFFDLHLSAAGCHYCSPNKYACLTHAKHLCSCSWGAKFFLFRYDLNELNLLVEALEGKLSAIYRWARMDLGLALASYRLQDNKIKPQSPKIVEEKSPCSSEASRVRETNVRPIVVLALQHQNEKTKAESSKSSKINGVIPLKQKVTPGDSVTLGSSLRKPEALKISELPQDLSCNTNLTQKSQIFQERNDVILLSDDEGEESSPNPIKNESNTSIKLTKEQDHEVDMASVTTNGPVKAEDKANGETHPGLNQQDPSSLQCILSIGDNQVVEEGNSIQNIQLSSPPLDASNANSENIPKIIESDTNSRTENAPNALCNDPCVSPNTLDRYFRQQKGPRIAKMVRRINCNVEPQEFGVIQCGKSWCDAHAIYPKGFRSRVKYINVLDPTVSCYYVSEILDVGRDGPLFMVLVEESPGEVFVHVSSSRCWEMVRERVNQEITKQHKLGNPKLPPLQPPGSLDGNEMFGLTSPAIIQVIQKMDEKRVCREYWKSRPLMQIPRQSNGGKSIVNSKGLNNEQQTCRSHDENEEIIGGLLKKGSLEELDALYSVLIKDQLSVTELLSEEIHKRPK